MSHIKQNTTRKSRKFRILIIGSFILCLFTMMDIFAPKAHAAVKNGLTHKSNPSRVLKANLADLSGQKTVILDWRTQSHELAFNLPAHDWYETLDVFISAVPEGSVSARTPLLISFNGADPIALNGRGSPFDAHIRLDTSQIRTANNTLKITYQTPSDAQCLTGQHGKWVFDLNRSKVVAKTRAKQRNMNISEIENRLAHAMTAPKNVAILAKGTHKNALEAILAQGIAQRTHTLPNFQFTNARADFSVLIGTNAQLSAYVQNKNLLSATSPRIFVDTGINPKLVLSAPNEQQVLKLARAFSSYHLPSKNRPDVSIFDLYSAKKLAPRAILAANSYKLSDIGNVSISPSWRPKPSRLSFNVDNAQSSTGTLTLNIASGAGINSKSRLNIALNNRSLGYTKLDKKSKNVAFKISEGDLKSSENTLVFTPNLVSNDTNNLCASQDNIPSFMVSSQSNLVIKNEKNIPVTDLSHLAANGSMFNMPEGETALVLTARSAKDRAATLRILGFAARRFGSKWVEADYFTSLPTKAELNKNILIIGPNAKLDPRLLAGAPKAFKLAMGGKSSNGQAVQKMAKLERHASNSEIKSFQIAARTTGVPARINSGGIASIFPSPYINGKLIGIISATRPAHFSTAMNSLSTEHYWNALQGSVARWNKSAIIMAQTSTPLPATFFPQKQKPTAIDSFKNTKANISTWFANIKLQKPTLVRHKSGDLQNAPRQLRGPSQAAVPIPRIKPRFHLAPKAISLNASSITFPSLSQVQSSVISKFKNVKAMLTGGSNNSYSAQSAYEWVGNLKSNRLAWLLLIVLAGFILMAFTSPKEAGSK